jgi:AraC family transcriptional regulator, glycine betaine-responsive activator
MHGNDACRSHNVNYPPQSHSGRQIRGAPPLCLLLLDKFTMLSFAGAVEPLRIATGSLGARSTAGRLRAKARKEAVTCSNGAAFRLDMGLDEIDRDDTVLVCGGIDVQRTTKGGHLNWLRREARRGAAIGGLCTGAYALAKAGLLDGKKATIHWENQDGFLEEFEDVKLTKSVFVIDGNRLSTAGGTRRST